MAGEDPKYADWVRQQRCLVESAGGCGGRIEAHHAGRAGMGQRPHDDTCVPLCTAHHRAWHDASGPFKRMCKAERREWAEAAIRLVRAAHAVDGVVGVDAPGW